MKMSELILAIGDDNVVFQNLDNDATSLNYNIKSGTKVTFGTDMALTPSGTKRLGLVLWLDRDAVKAALASAAGGRSPETNEDSAQPEGRQSGDAEGSATPKTATDSIP